MLFKKTEKTEPKEVIEELEGEKELSPLQEKVLEKLKAIYDKTMLLESYKNQKIINSGEYQKELTEIMEELDELERDLNADNFDKLMGRPMLSFPEIFGDMDFNEQVHKAIEECERESNISD